MTQTKKPTNQEIQLKAYERYLARNGEPGDELSDWLEAEQELMAASNLTKQTVEGIMIALPARTLPTKNGDRRAKQQLRGLN